MSMDSKLKSILIKTILEKIPENIKPVNYITDILNLSRESVYRRINGQLDFTLAEIVKLSFELDFSLDNIYSQYDKDIVPFHFILNKQILPKESFLMLLQAFWDRMQAVYNAKGKHTDMAINRLLSSMILHYSHLYRFHYYKWLHQFGNVPLNYYYSDVNFTDETISQIQQASYYQLRLPKTIIMDENIFYNLIQEIKYYQGRGLINDKEISLLKKDINNFLKEFELILKNGENHTGTKWEVYLCSINVCSNVTCLNFGDEVSSSYWMHADATFTTDDPQVYKTQKAWITSLKRYSTLITQSNQQMQASFLNQQYKYLEEL